jgi:hypothetical protein
MKKIGLLVSALVFCIVSLAFGQKAITDNEREKICSTQQKAVRKLVKKGQVFSYVFDLRANRLVCYYLVAMQEYELETLDSGILKKGEYGMFAIATGLSSLSGRILDDDPKSIRILPFYTDMKKFNNILTREYDPLWRKVLDRSIAEGKVPFNFLK